MATLKAYTDLEQSKKLAKILPLESADMFWYRDAVTKEANPRIMNYMQVPELQSMYYSPCWSLTALLEILNDAVIYKTDDYIASIYYLDNVQGFHKRLLCKGNSYIDACYEMILKLHKQKLL